MAGSPEMGFGFVVVAKLREVRQLTELIEDLSDSQYEFTVHTPRNGTFTGFHDTHTFTTLQHHDVVFNTGMQR